MGDGYIDLFGVGKDFRQIFGLLGECYGPYVVCNQQELEPEFYNPINDNFMDLL